MTFTIWVLRKDYTKKTTLGIEGNFLGQFYKGRIAEFTFVQNTISSLENVAKANFLRDDRLRGGFRVSQVSRDD